MENKPIPEGYWRNARGGLDPVETIKPIDRARDELVRELVAKGARCFVRGDSIIGSAPELPYEEGEI